MEDRSTWERVKHCAYDSLMPFLTPDNARDMEQAIMRQDYNYVPGVGIHVTTRCDTIFSLCIWLCAPSELIQEMMKAGADPNYVFRCPAGEPDGRTVLVEAIRKYKASACYVVDGHRAYTNTARLFECITVMITSGNVDPSLSRGNTETILSLVMTAVQTRAGRPLVRLLLSRGEDPEQIVGGMPAVLWAVTWRSDATIDLLAFGANPFRRCPSERVTAIERINKMGRPPEDTLWVLRIFEEQERQAMAFLKCWNRLCRQDSQEGTETSLAALPRDLIKLVFHKIKYANNHCMLIRSCLEAARACSHKRNVVIVYSLSNF